MTFGLLSIIILGACCFHDLGLVAKQQSGAGRGVVRLFFGGKQHGARGYFSRSFFMIFPAFLNSFSPVLGRLEVTAIGQKEPRQAMASSKSLEEQNEVLR